MGQVQSLDIHASALWADVGPGSLLFATGCDKLGAEIWGPLETPTSAQRLPRSLVSE